VELTCCSLHASVPLNGTALPQRELGMPALMSFRPVTVALPAQSGLTTCRYAITHICTMCIVVVNYDRRFGRRLWVVSWCFMSLSAPWHVQTWWLFVNRFISHNLPVSDKRHIEAFVRRDVRLQLQAYSTKDPTPDQPAEDTDESVQQEHTKPTLCSLLPVTYWPQLPSV